MQAPSLLKFYVVLSILTFVWEHYGFNHGNTLESLQAALLIICAYATALFTSMLIYRKYFHRLRNFPGPWLAGATKFWHVYQCRNSQNHFLLDDIYRKYGEIVRTGPEELTIFHPEVLPATDGPGNSCTKAVWYDFLLPEIALNTTRSKPEHDHRRRIWDHGFSTKALDTYEGRIAEYAETLEKRIADLASHGHPVNVTSWFYFFTFDVMGEFAFAKSFGMLEDERWHIAVVMLRKAMRLLGPLSPVPWLAQIGFYIVPWIWVVRDWLAMLVWCRERMAERIKMEGYKPDVSHWLIDASMKTNTLKLDREWLNGDAVTIIIAGSDTVAPTLVFIFYLLAIHQDQQDKLREALESVDIYDRKALRGVDHLTGVINESLRIHPPVPTGGYRQSPDDGMKLAGQYIPPRTTIVSPRYTLGKLPSCFEKPGEFIPERWYSKPEMVKDKRAFAPFAQGRYSCVGKNLAMGELRLVTALLVKKYRIRLASGEDGKRVEEDLRDQFTAAPGELNLSFEVLKSDKS
ncbi:hypothetical protein G7Y89_g8848 [Cudoniella acicularis]|uniref:Cytochrome P450 n=1 Tax=Cudoniella acicularis TaxID=354080 RepID=A0A8H4RI05_9HELO|nr:hypothetical protein G7Y89_g8848 [Cudoniella acicularis]